MLSANEIAAAALADQGGRSTRSSNIRSPGRPSRSSRAPTWTSCAAAACSTPALDQRLGAALAPAQVPLDARAKADPLARELRGAGR